MKRATKEALLDALVLGGGVTLVVAVLSGTVGCTKTVYVDGPTPVSSSVPAASPTPAGCFSVSRDRGDCHQSNQDIYLAEYTAAVDAAKLNPAITWKDEITNGPAYLQFLITNLQEHGLCAGIYENEEVAIWSKADQTFSENWDTIIEASGQPLRPRYGPGAHSYTCNPATTGSGS